MDTGSIPVVATSILREAVCCFDKGDTVIAETGRHGVRVNYTSTRASRDARDVTRLECQVDFQSSQMWVGDLRLARSLQSNGIGRQLAAAAERIALALGLQTVNVFPLTSCGHFWKRMGYTSRPRTARVVTKDLAKDRSVVPADHEESLESTAS
jgi:GNAT superfamily N-acetyltransferase